MKTILFSLMLGTSHLAFAKTVQTWQGPGSTFDLQGQVTSSYELTVENTKNEGQTDTRVTIAFPDGRKIEKQCLMTEKTKESWTVQCDHGNGGGQCFGEGLCISYEADANGHAFATTIIVDGENDMRLLRTELQDGKAVRFFREKLQRK